MPILAENEPPAPELVGQTRAGPAGGGPEPRSQIDDGGLWDLASAEALTVIYESELGAYSCAADEDIASAVAALTRVGGRVRLEDRLADIANRLERSLAGVSAPPADALTVRFDALEARIEAALHGVATRSELEPLKGATARLEALAATLDDARARLDRLPDVEGRLGEALELLSDERLRAPDADSIAEKLARQLSRDGQPPPGDELARVLADFAAERREHDAQIAAVLDTMQQAMVRILDRIDTVDSGELGPILEEPSAAPGEDIAAPALDISRSALAPRPEGGQPADGPVRERGPHAARPAPVAAEPGPRTTIDKIRQAFIADAQRAKLRAEAEAESTRMAVLAAPAQPRHWAKARFDAALVKGIPVKRVLAAALGLLVVIQAANVLLARKPSVAERPEASSVPIGGSDAAGVPAGDAAAPGRGPSAETEGVPGSSDAPQRSGFASPDADARKLAMVPEALAESVPESAAAETGTPGESEENAAAQPAALHPGEAAAEAAGAEANRATKLLDLPPASVGPLSLRLAAANGNASAEFEVGARFAEGKGPGQDFKAAARWYQRAASRGFAQAQYRLGTLYERGLGVSLDLARAGAWYRRAAEQGNIAAMHNFAVLSAGSAAAAPDYATAARWFLEAAERGLADSQYNLAVLHENGLGVPKDLQIAYKWFALAARSGDAEAARRRDEAKARLAAADIAAADESAHAWRAKPVDALANDARIAGDAWRRSSPETSG